MDAAEFKRLVDMVRPVLRHSADRPSPPRNVWLYLAMDAGERDGAYTLPSTQELLDRWVAESKEDKNAWYTLDLLATTLSLMSETLPAKLVAWAGAERPAGPRDGAHNANLNRAIRVVAMLLRETGRKIYLTRNRSKKSDWSVLVDEHELDCSAAGGSVADILGRALDGQTAKYTATETRFRRLLGRRWPRLT